MTIYESIFLSLEFSEEHNFMEFTWFASTVDLTDEDYKAELLNYLKFCLELKPRRTIMNLTNLFFTVAPQLQEWTEQNIVLPFLEVGATELALVISPEFIVQLAAEQIIEESSSITQVTSKYFGTIEEAREWILSFSDVDSTINLKESE